MTNRIYFFSLLSCILRPCWRMVGNLLRFSLSCFLSETACLLISPMTPFRALMTGVHCHRVRNVTVCHASDFRRPPFIAPLSMHTTAPTLPAGTSFCAARFAFSHHQPLLGGGALVLLIEHARRRRHHCDDVKCSLNATGTDMRRIHFHDTLIRYLVNEAWQFKTTDSKTRSRRVYVQVN